MKKVLTYLLAVVLGVACCFTFIGCGDGDVDLSALAAKIQESQGMTTAELLEKAKTETGNFVAYGNTSRITTAMTNFIASDYGKALGLTDSNALAAKKTDSEIYELLMNEYEASNKSQAASMVLVQDSATLSQYLSRTDILANYIPKGVENLVDEDYLVPLAHQFINKLFMYNTAGDSNCKFTNVWQLTESAYKNKIYFKKPSGEQVNMNFLIMLTKDEWAQKLEAAYLKYNNNTAATDVGSGKTYANYGYKWIAGFLANCNFSINSDTTIAQSLSQPENAGNMGLFVLSKLRDSSVLSDNLAVSAWDKKEGSETELETIEPFAGFMYAIYAQLATAGPRPYTAMLFINYLMTEEGFAPWASMGGYSSSSEVPVTEGDSPLSFWTKNLVVEDGAYIKTVKVQVSDWINKLTA